MANDKNFVVKNGLEVGQGITANTITANTINATLTGTANNTTNLNGQAASYYLDYNNFTNTPTYDNFQSVGFGLYSTTGAFDDPALGSYGITVGSQEAIYIHQTETPIISANVIAAGFVSGLGNGAAVELGLNLKNITTSTADGDGDYFVVVDTSGNQKKLTKANINLSGFNNDAGFVTSSGATELNDLLDVSIANGDVRLRPNNGDDSFYALWLAGQGASGVGNIAIGERAYRNEGGATGTNNIALGTGAMQNPAGVASTSSNNVAIGIQAGFDLTTGANNVIIGANAASSSTTAIKNVVIGDGAFANNTTGGYNTILGTDAGAYIRSGTANIGIGANALRGDFGSGLTGSYNIALGFRAGYNISSGTHNIALGYDSGKNLFGGDQNITIGSYAGDIISGGNNNIVIGYGADASNSSINDEITLGNSSITRFRIPGLDLDTANAADAQVLAWSTANNGFYWTTASGYEHWRLSTNGTFNYNVTSNSTLDVVGGSGIDVSFLEGALTISHTDTSSQGSVNNSGRTYIQDITLDAYGHVTGLVSATETVVNTDTNTTYNLLSPGSGVIRLQDSANSNDNITITGSGATSVTSNSTHIIISSTDNNTTYLAGTGLTLSGTTFNLDFSELTDMTGDISGTTEFILQNGTTESRKAANEIKLSAFNNDSGFVTTDTNTTYDLLAVANTAANAGLLRLKDSSNANDTVTFAGSGATTVSSNATHIIISSTDTNTDTTYAAGTGLALSGTTFNLDFSELLGLAGTGVDGNTEFILHEGSNEARTPANEIKLSIFNNDAGFITSADGGNAATLDGIDSTSFLRSDVADVAFGALTFSADIQINDRLLAGDNPGTSGQILSSTGTGVSWIDAPTGGSSVTTSTTEPSSPNNGDLWWDTDEGILSLYDVSANNWISVTNDPGAYNINGLLDGYTDSSNNISLGNLLPYISGGSNNVVLGFSAGDNLETGHNNIIIGHAAEPTGYNASNEITLGNSATQRFRIPGAAIDNTSLVYNATGGLSLNVSERDTYIVNSLGNITFSFTGFPLTGPVATITIVLTAGGSYTVTWPASVKWSGGTAPDAPASGETDVYTFISRDGGSTIYGFAAGDAMA